MPRSILLAILMGFSAATAQAERCFTNLATYNELKAELPAPFQNNPIFLKCGNCGSPTGIKVGVSAGGISSAMMTGGTPSPSPVQKICINGANKLTIYGQYTLPVTVSGNSVVIASPIGNYNMTVTTQTALQQHLSGGVTAFGSNGNR